jgi:hypothetical protein
MFVWIKKGATSEGDIMLSWDPPEEAEEHEWDLYTTRDRHYAAIAKELDKQVKLYEKQNDYRAAKVAKDLAETLRKKPLDNTAVN